jgi:hypothetical protein
MEGISLSLEMNRGLRSLGITSIFHGYIMEYALDSIQYPMYIHGYTMVYPYIP